MAADSNPLLIVGAGLTGSLTALALMKWRPDTPFILIDQAPRFGGGPIRPFFLGSVPLSNGSLIDSMIVRNWAGYRVAGPGFSRISDGRTAYLVPEQIHVEVLQALPPDRYLLGKKVVGIERGGVSLADGWFLRGSLVLDMRGDSAHAQSGIAWRQTTSRLLRTSGPHGLELPILVDATFPASEWTFLQYCPVDPVTLLVQYVGYFPDPALRSIDTVAATGKEGRLLDEMVHMEALLGVPSSARNPGRILAQASLAERWNPILSSSVAGATRIAKAIADASVMSEEGLRPRMERLAASASQYRHRFAFLIELLSANDPLVRASALSALAHLGREAMGRVEAADARGDDIEHLKLSAGFSASRESH